LLTSTSEKSCYQKSQRPRNDIAVPGFILPGAPAKNELPHVTSGAQRTSAKPQPQQADEQRDAEGRDGRRAVSIAVS
jgi:hypothetical protein